MSQSNLIELTYFDPKACVRLTTYADTIITDKGKLGSTITAIRFGGYPEMVRAMSDAIYGGAAIAAAQKDEIYDLESIPKAYRRELSHDGLYATATLMIDDEALSADPLEEDDGADQAQSSVGNRSWPKEPKSPKPRRCYIFCPAGDRDRLFEELDRKTAAPLIPAFRDYVLDELIARNILRQMAVFSLREKLDAWVLELLPNDRNVVDVLEQGLREGKIAIPGKVSDGFEAVDNVTSYLTTFGVIVADRIRNQFTPLFDPASEPLSDEVLSINSYVQEKAGYSLYDAQLAVAEAVKRQLDHRNIALIVAECGTGKTKIGSTALGALQGHVAASSGRTPQNLQPRPLPRPCDKEVGAGDQRDAAEHLRSRSAQHHGAGPSLRHVCGGGQERVRGYQQRAGQRRLHAISCGQMEPPAAGLYLSALHEAHPKGVQCGRHKLSGQCGSVLFPEGA